MKTLAIDTSLGTGSVAAADDEGAVSIALGPAGDHARRLMPLLQEAAAARGWRLRDVDLVAVMRGPGSFTGLRVGVATAKAIAWSCQARLVAVCGFEVVARRTAASVGATETMAIAFDAGRDEVFAGMVRRRDQTADRWQVEGPALHPFEAWLAGLPAGCLVSGPALMETRAGLEARHGLRLAPPAARFAEAIDVARLARIAAAAGALDDPATLVPQYLRPSYADEHRVPAG